MSSDPHGLLPLAVRPAVAWASNNAKGPNRNCCFPNLLPTWRSHDSDHHHASQKYGGSQSPALGFFPVPPTPPHPISEAVPSSPLPLQLSPWFGSSSVFRGYLARGQMTSCSPKSSSRMWGEQTWREPLLCSGCAVTCHRLTDVQQCLAGFSASASPHPHLPPHCTQVTF